MTAATPAKHPAPYSPEIIDALGALISDVANGRVPAAKTAMLSIEPIRHVHDPFAGEGVRLGALCDRLGVSFSGTELEAPFIIDKRVRFGNSTKRGSYPRRRHVIVTSPVYPNGIADHFEAKDTSRRRTYRAARAAIVGTDAPLHPDNQGRWGYRGTPLHSTQRAMYWALARKVVACWTADVAFVNVSDFAANGVVEPVSAGWCHVLAGHGWTVLRVVPVRTRRWRDGANRDARVENEVIIVAVRSGL